MTRAADTHAKNRDQVPEAGRSTGLKTIANLFTLSRLLLLIVAATLFYAENPVLHLLNFVLIIVIFATDALDGYVASKRIEASLFGALFDISRCTDLRRRRVFDTCAGAFHRSRNAAGGAFL